MRSEIEFRPVRSADEPAAAIWCAGEVGVEPVALIVQDDEENPRAHRWVCGIVARNPWFGDGGDPPDDLPRLLRETELVVGVVGSQHPLGEERSYHMQSCQVVSAGRANVAVVRVDW